MITEVQQLNKLHAELREMLATAKASESKTKLSTYMDCVETVLQTQAAIICGLEMSLKQPQQYLSEQNKRLHDILRNHNINPLHQPKTF